MRRTEIEDDGADILAGTSVPSSGPPHGPTLIPFRRTDTSAASGSAAGGDPPSPPDNWEPLVSVTDAVVLRLANKRVRIKVTGPGARESGGNLDQS